MGVRVGLERVLAHRRAASPASAAMIAAGIIAFGTQPVAAIDDDVPKRQPALAWEVPVECDTDVVLAEGSGRRCILAFAHDVVYVHEHTRGADGVGSFRLSAHDVTTGAVRWSDDVGETFEIRVTDGAVVLNDKAHIEVFDAETGAARFHREGRLLQHNDYGVVLIDAGDGGVTAIDAADGAELWSMPGQVGAMCRDWVAVVPAPNEPAAPFALVDHRSGRIRWESDVEFDPRTSHMACSAAPWIYVTDGQRVYEMDSFDGWTTWETAVPNAGRVDLYREVALVRSGPTGDTVTAVRREDGVVLWQAPADRIGSSLSWIGRLREDATGVFTLHPLTGQTVQRVDLSPSGDSPFDIVGVSDTRVVVAVGTTIAAYGMNDLGLAWHIDVGSEPDDFGVTNGYLVVRSGDVLQGYAAMPRASG